METRICKKCGVEKPLNEFNKNYNKKYCKYYFRYKCYENNYNKKWKDEYLSQVHIDHIKPLKYAKTEEEIEKLCHYTNLQLLKAEDNLKKQAKYIET